MKSLNCYILVMIENMHKSQSYNLLAETLAFCGLRITSMTEISAVIRVYKEMKLTL